MTVDRYLRVTITSPIPHRTKIKKDCKILTIILVLKAKIARFSFGFRLNTMSKCESEHKTISSSACGIIAVKDVKKN